MKDQILNLLKSPDKTNQELALTIAESNNINIDEEFWNLLQVIYRLNHKSIGNKEELLMLFNKPSLGLSNLKLTHLPESIGILTNLENLYLQNNQLTHLPDSIGNLNNIQFLILDKNQLTSIPESIGNLKNLKTLNLNNNQLTSLPESIGMLTNLQWLYLQNNQLTSIEQLKLKTLLPSTNIYLCSSNRFNKVFRNKYKI